MLLLDNFVDIFPTFQFQSVFIHLFLNPAPSAQLKVPTIFWMDESLYFLDIWIITSKCIFCDVHCERPFENDLNSMNFSKVNNIILE